MSTFPVKTGHGHDLYQAHQPIHQRAGGPQRHRFDKGGALEAYRAAGAYDQGERGVQCQHGQDPGAARDHQPAQPGP